MPDKGHRRDETRTIQVLPAPAGLFPQAAQAFLIERRVRDPGTSDPRSAVAAPGVTSRTPGRAGTPEALTRAIRSHREIEALHHIRNVTRKVDAQGLRAGPCSRVPVNNPDCTDRRA